MVLDLDFLGRLKQHPSIIGTHFIYLLFSSTLSRPRSRGSPRGAGPGVHRRGAGRADRPRAGRRRPQQGRLHRLPGVPHGAEQGRRSVQLAVSRTEISTLVIVEMKVCNLNSCDNEDVGWGTWGCPGARIPTSVNIIIHSTHAVSLLQHVFKL